MHLYIAYKNYSSWSLRPWLVMKVTGIPFNETVLPFYHNDGLDQLAEKLSIPAKVPVLQHEGSVIWDSLAIMEYLAETYVDRQLWPEDKALRVIARSVSNEMHSSFMDLRQLCPMNCRSQKRLSSDNRAAIQSDLNRLAALWEYFEKADTPEGDFLCGSFGIVDAMYAPVMWRVLGYGLHVSETFNQWSAAMMALPAMQEWLAAAQVEQWTIEEFETCGDSLSNS